MLYSVFPLPERDPVLLGLLCKALLPLFIQTPHLAESIQVFLCFFCQREIWSVQVETGTVPTGEGGRHTPLLG